MELNVYWAIMSLNNELCSSNKTVSVNADGDRVRIAPVDYDAHFIELQLNGNLEATVALHSLPDIDNLFKPFGTVEFFANTFFNLLDQMGTFYTQMNVIDELCDVVDPIEYSTKCSYRVFKLGAN